MRIDGKKKWVYSDTKTESYKTNHIKGVAFFSPRLSIESDGTLTVWASENNPFSWDGCTPKWEIAGILVGTPEGAINPFTGLSRTRSASKFHDALYQFAPQEVSRKQIDKVFLEILRHEGFELARVYYVVVRLFGWAFRKKK